MYGDELHLLTNKDGSPVPPNAIAYDRTYLFRWEGDQKYECVAQDIPGKINSIPHCFFVSKYLNKLEFHEQKMTQIDDASGQPIN